VKILLLDQSDRLLLLQGAESAATESVWFPVGGGIEDGEDAVTASLREIGEETGCREVRLGPEVWWFVARTLHFTPTPHALTEHEQSYITGFRWWTAEELVSTTERVFPPDLGARLTDLLRDGAPASPLDISEGEHARP
jgi:hypothetical protein